MEELEVFIDQHKIELIALTETIPKNSNNESEHKFILPGFKCEQNNNGRGVCLFIKENIEFLRLTELEDLFTPCVFSKITLPNNEFFIPGVIYRSPASNDIENKKLNELLDTVAHTYQNHQFVLVGDLNYPDIDWISEECNKSEDHRAFKFLNTVHKNYLTQFVDKPTHYRCMQTPTLIDLILSNNPDFILNLKHFPAFGLSHHSVLTFNLNVNISSDLESPVLKFQINKGDYEQMRKMFQNIDWDAKFISTLSVNDWWEIFENEINTAKEKCIPKKAVRNPTFKRTFHAPFTLLESIQEKRRAFKWKLAEVFTLFLRVLYSL